MLIVGNKGVAPKRLVMTGQVGMGGRRAPVCMDFIFSLKSGST